eukprot:CAMPEP_0202685908 /NCGR_PEP_ID=MMETSP1385-20130828/1727_1 /ASSEMBLY_ACC=CAM_ASM_000861 /TAXON_ID=933848 /ORGANISM="Elphidium margaritaceum" /LENGTH=517 /DNA_ID=CAMNT_0049340381 /DNA_START=64 /DNA_END=1617 /DNA_ORIENTATION=+
MRSRQKVSFANTANSKHNSRNLQFKQKWRTQRKKTRHGRVASSTQEELEAPKSFIIVRGRVTKFCKFLRDDLRVIFSPFTAVKLQEKHSNSLKDFEAAATDFGVTHILTLSQSDIAGTMLRMIRLPKGPTFWFRIAEYALIQDMVRMQSEATQTMLHWRAINAMKVNKCTQFVPPATQHALQFPPLVILNGFGEKSASAVTSPASNHNRATHFHRQLMAVMFKHMFAPMNVIKLKLTQCKRVVFFNYDHNTDTVHVRHFKIELAQDMKDISKGVKKLVKKKRVRKLSSQKNSVNDADGSGHGEADGVYPDLGRYQDITEYVEQNKDGNASESEAEDDEQTKVVLEQVRNRMTAAEKKERNAHANGDGDGEDAGAAVSNARFVRLKEIGPRISMQLIKIEELVNDGRVLYHRFVQKTDQEMAELQRRKETEKKTKEQRKVKQMLNVQQKERALKERADDKLERQKQKEVAKLLHSFDVDDDKEQDKEEEMIAQNGQKRERDEQDGKESKAPKYKKRKM